MKHLLLLALVILIGGSLQAEADVNDSVFNHIKKTAIGDYYKVGNHDIWPIEDEFVVKIEFTSDIDRQQFFAQSGIDIDSYIEQVRRLKWPFSFKIA